MKAALLCFGWILILGLALFVSGCSPIYYASNAHNVPLFKEKNEVRLNAGITATEDLSGPDVQVAYAVGKNVGLIANGINLSSGTVETWHGHGYLTEAGIGYFKPIKKNYVAEIYAGGGFAKVFNQRQNSPYNTIDINFLKYFIQPAFGFNSNHFEVALSPRIALVHYDEPLSLEYTHKYEIDANGYIIPQQQQTFFVFEPGLTIRGGWKYLKIQLQAITSFQDIPNAEALSLNLSFSINLAKRFREVAE